MMKVSWFVVFLLFTRSVLFGVVVGFFFLILFGMYFSPSYVFVRVFVLDIRLLPQHRNCFKPFLKAKSNRSRLF